MHWRSMYTKDIGVLALGRCTLRRNRLNSLYWAPPHGVSPLCCQTSQCVGVTWNFSWTNCFPSGPYKANEGEHRACVPTRARRKKAGAFQACPATLACIQVRRGRHDERVLEKFGKASRFRIRNRQWSQTEDIGLGLIPPEAGVVCVVHLL